ncbi:MAG: PilZ domain-containing protein [Acidobacteria bacterium]|nr:PilZ domain-containing protein [Acidobacteriota bacterium]
MGKITDKLRTAFSRFVLEWGVSPRYEVDLPLCFRIAYSGRSKKSSRIIQGNTYDLSESGISILSPTIFVDGMHAHFNTDINTHLEIELPLPHKSINIIGETCRYIKIDSQEYSYLLGVKFLKISQADKKLLLDYLENIKRKPQTVHHVIKPNFET